KDRGYLDDLKAGFRYVRGNKPVSILLLFFGLTFFLIVPAATLTPLLVTRTYGAEVWRLTANEVTFFAGSIVGGFILTLWGGFKNHFRTIGLACLVWAVLFFSLGITNNFYLYLFVMFLAGFPMPYWGTAATTLLQLIVQPEMQGRVFGLQQLIMSSVMPLGMMVFGPIADLVSIETILLIVSPLMLAPGIWIFLKQAPAAPLVSLETEELEVEIQH
ncbi:MFS transporter, partial [bacterium]